MNSVTKTIFRAFCGKDSKSSRHQVAPPPFDLANLMKTWTCIFNDDEKSLFFL